LLLASKGAKFVPTLTANYPQPSLTIESNRRPC
jgi:hypothetical protein